MKKSVLAVITIIVAISAIGFLAGCNNPTGEGGEPPQTYYYNPTWTPTDAILVERNYSGSSCLIMITQEGASDTVLFPLSWESWSINCAPDNTKIAITYKNTSYSPLQLNFKISDITGTIETAIPNITWESEFYDWSSDSKKCLFSGVTNIGTSGVFCYDFEHDILTNLISAEDGSQFTWHNGSKIMYKVGDGAYLINSDNTGRQMASSWAIEESPQYFPDGDLTISYYACAIIRYRLSNGARSLINITPYPTFFSNAQLSFDGTEVVCSDINGTGICLFSSSGGGMSKIR